MEEEGREERRAIEIEMTEGKGATLAYVGVLIKLIVCAPLQLLE